MTVRVYVVARYDCEEEYHVLLTHPRAIGEAEWEAMALEASGATRVPRDDPQAAVAAAAAYLVGKYGFEYAEELRG